MPETRLALDRASVREVDQDGHLHVARSNISRAAVNGYLGREIPEFEALGLQPDRLYQLYRDPRELAKAVDSFNGKPLLSSHQPQTAADHSHDLTVGSVHNVEWHDPFLTAELAVWDDLAIAGITSGEQEELSSAYRYKADMTAGEFEGTKYDGIMRDITGNHVALVTSGRAGSSVVVADSALNPQETYTMATPAVQSRAALYASGALRAYLRPKLAKDGKIDLRPMLASLTKKTFKAERPKLKLALDAALAGKLAKDASISDIDELLDEVQAQINDLADPEEDKPAEDEEAETEEEKKARLAKRAADKAAKDEFPPKRDDEKDKDKKPAMDTITKPAMDAAIAASVAAARAEERAIRDAEREVRPWYGDFALAQDSAASVFQTALKALNVEATGITDLAALRLVLNAQPKPGDGSSGHVPRMARDMSSEEAKFRAAYPTASKLIRS